MVATQNEQIRAEIEGKEQASKSKGSGKLSLEMQFFQRVWMPCLLLYGKYPQRMLRRARAGDRNALTDLLRLDKSVIFDKRIAEMTHRSWIENPGLTPSICLCTSLGKAIFSLSIFAS